MRELKHDLDPPNSATAGRHRKRNALIPAFGAMILLLNGLPASADTIAVTYDATQQGGSSWEYVYTISGSVSAGDLLAVYFPVATDSEMTDLSTTTAVFTTSVLQPDGNIPADGEYDIAMNSATSLFSDVFAVSFTYSGTGAPGAQDFTLYDSSFATITSGTTTEAAAAAPEPGAWTLLLAGLLAVVAYLSLGKPRQHGGLATPVAALILLALPAAIPAQTGPPGGGPPGGTPPSGGGPPGVTTSPISGMSIGPYNLLNSYRASTYQYYYEYTTSVTNTNSAAYTYVLGTLTSSSANTVVVSATVEFGLVPGGGSATGLTSFTILQDRRYAFDPSSLSWAFTGASSTASVGTSTSAVSLSASALSTTYGTGIDLTATVSPSTATGTVTFYDGPLPVGTATVASGSAELPA